MSPPVVSIVTIFFNAVRFLEDAVASVLAQTYERWELLLVDDGSTDGSSEIGRTLAARHLDRVRYLEHPDHANRGMSASRNLGIRHGRGDLVALLDADDVWEPEKLTRQVALLEAHSEVDLVYGAPLYWFGWTRDAAAAGRGLVSGSSGASRHSCKPSGACAGVVPARVRQRSVPLRSAVPA